MDNCKNMVDGNDTYIINPYHPSPFLVSFLIIGAVFIGWLAIDGLLFGFREDDKAMIAFSVCFCLFLLYLIALILFLLYRSSVTVMVSQKGICIKRGKRIVIPQTLWTQFHKVYILSDYRGKQYFIVSKTELLVGMQKTLLLKLSDNLPKVITDDCITLWLRGDALAKIVTLINEAIPIERDEPHA